MDITEFINAHEIAMTAKPVKSNPYMPDPGMRHWLCTFNRPNGFSFQVHFSQGSAHTEEPTAADVLDCLASDACGYDNAGGDFETWADEYGYDTDSRKAEATHTAIGNQRDELERFMGDQYPGLLYETERL